MNLKDYFSQTTGVGVLSTADSDGKVNSAIYASPHFLEENRVSFIMRDRLTHANITSNPNANYMFIEESTGLKGIRVNLHKISESADQEQISTLSRRKTAGDSEEQRYLVTFRIEKILALIGGHEYPIDAYPGAQSE